MQVKKRLKINNAVMAMSFIALIAVLVVTALRVTRAMEQNQIADTLMTAQFERLALRTDYLHTDNERARQQVRAKNEQVGELLKSAAEKFTDPKDKQTVAALLEGQESIGKIFHAIVANRQATEAKERDPVLSGEVESRLLGQLNMRVYESAILGGKLQESSKAAFVASLKTAGWGSACILLLVSVVSLINSVTINRTIAGRIGRLRDGAAIIGNGNLDHRTDIKGDDEFAELADSFNDMTERLRGSYHDLEKEIEERKRAEEALNKAHYELALQMEERVRELQEKEVLLKEIHHRVKNNLQVISSLVGMQADGAQDEAVREVLTDVIYRVRSMALVHEKLYHSESLSRIDFAEYAQSLLGYLWRAHGAAAGAIKLTLDLEPVELPVDIATPCGLILNELAGNALKHAFRGRTEGEVTVSLHGVNDGCVSLSVRDNGGGLPERFDWRQSNTLGLRLVQLLAGQLQASVDVDSSSGTEFLITFKLPEAAIYGERVHG